VRQIELQTGAFRPGTSQPESHAILLRLLETLVELDRAGVRYRREPLGSEQWRTIPLIQADGYGDCEDLASWRVAELREAGVPARPCFRFRRHGKRRVYHIMVCLPDGAVEDPSRVLGMGWAE
jgi:hypothetical protein